MSVLLLLILLFDGALAPRKLLTLGDVQELAWPAKQLVRHELQLVDKIAEASEQRLKLRGERFVRANADSAILEMFMSDCTPSTTLENIKSAWDEFFVLRRARSSKEYLGQRLFLCTLASMCLVVGSMRCLLDKTAWTHFNAMDQMWEGCRRLGHKGYVITFACFDRAVKSPMHRYILQHAKAFDKFLIDNLPAGQATQRILRHWVVVVGCCAHDFHNALKWSVLMFLKDKAVMRDSWIVLASLRSSYEQLVLYLPKWLEHSLGFAEWQGEQAFLIEWWEFVGLEGKWLALFVSLQLRFHSNRLWVAARFQDDAQIVNKITCALLYLWKFKKFSETRWCTLGNQCRRMVGAVSLGLRELVGSIHEDARESDYYLNGFSRLSTAILEMMCVVSATSQVSEKALLLTKADARLAKVLPEIDQTLDAEAERCWHLSTPKVLMLSQICGVPESLLRTRIGQSTLTQLAFSRHRIREARGLPWCLARGDVLENLVVFSTETRPAHCEVSQRIWDELEMGVPPEDLVEPVSLLLETWWSTQHVEDAHSVVTKQVQKHPQQTSATLLSRSMVIHFSQIVQFNKLQSRCDNMVHRLRNARLKLKNVQHISGQQAYISGLNRTACGIGTSPQGVSFRYSQEIVKRSAARWRALPPVVKLRWENEAAALKVSKRDTRQTQIAVIVKKLDALRTALQKRSQGARLANFDAVSLTWAEQLDFIQFLNNAELPPDYVKERRLEKSKKVGPPPVRSRETISCFPVPQRPRSRGPAWLSWMAHHREYFESTIVRFLLASGDHAHYKFVFATINPLLVCMHDAEHLAIGDVALEAVHSVVHGVNHWTHCFKVSLGL